MRTLRNGALVASAFALASCATNPVSGKSELSLVSEKDEIAMGKQGAADVATTIGLVQDQALQSYVNKLGLTLAAHTERPNLPWQYQVVDDPSVNAFALPGGYIFVTRGLLTSINNEAELATVLGHESGHVAAKHIVQQMSQQEVAQLGLGLGSMLSKDIAKYAGVAQAGLSVLFLKFSRDDESQADALGFKYALADNFDVRQMVPVFQMLDGLGNLSGGGKLPEWQSTHPTPQNRTAAINAKLAANTVSLAGTKVGRDEYLNLINGLVYGVNPRNGYFEGTLFLHPDLKFLVQFPSGWATQNANDAVMAGSPAQDALIELRVVPGTTASAAQTFFAQQGVTGGATGQGMVHGFPATMREFSAQDQNQASIHGMVAFIDFSGTTYRVLSYTSADKYGSYSQTFQQTIGSFDRLTDPRALGAQPNHVRLEHVPRQMTLEQFNQQYPSTISLAELALINGVDKSTVLAAGTSVKRITGGSLTQLSAN